MRIVSLLPSATEILFALGLGDDVLGVTHECDWPAEARTKPVLLHSALPTAAEPAEIDRLVSASLSDGHSLYRLDHEAVASIEPDLVITQNLCSVCALPSGEVEEALALLGSPANVVSLDPGSLEEVLGTVLRLGRLTGTGPAAEHLVDGLHERLAAVQRAVAGLPPPRTLALEWSDPPFNAGHWVPEMIRLAGGACLLAEPGRPSVRMTPAAIGDARAETVVFMPCGYGLEAATKEGQALLQWPELASASQIYAVDANGYFSRPGPRLVDGVEILASVLHPGAVPPPPAGTIQRLR
ncbi:MAG TPA: cobalamin-binding protein [Actinomycetota bacterium]|nr:cobalamin-binding protein [Actinomycetota bacterium]